MFAHILHNSFLSLLKIEGTPRRVVCVDALDGILAATSTGAGINAQQFTIDAATNRLGVPTGQAGAMSYDASGNLTTDTYTGFGTRSCPGSGASACLGRSHCRSLHAKTMLRMIFHSPSARRCHTVRYRPPLLDSLPPVIRLTSP